MYAASLQKRHMFDLSITFVKHHQKLAEVLLILAFISMIYSMTTYVESRYIPEIGQEFDMSGIMSESMRPLTRLSAPADAHEYSLRTAFITRSLERLLETSRVDRAYAVIYEYDASTAVRGCDLRVLESVEVRQAHIAQRFENIQGISRRAWLQIQQDERMLSKRSLNIFQSHGLELQNERGVAIGYLGFERKPGDGSFQDREIAQLRGTATAIKRGLLQPLDALALPTS